MVKKLFPISTAPGAIATHTNLGPDDVKILGFGNIPLNLTSQWIMKLNNPAAAEAYQVVMLSGRFHLIVVVVFVKVNLFYQTQFFELL
jgi:hypothetical protein